MGHHVKHIPSLVCLYMHGWRPGDSDVNSAILGENIVFVKWCLELGHVNKNALWVPFVNSNISQEMLRLLHEHKVPGSYTSACKNGTCAICKKRLLNDMWIMMTAKFDNRVQWLPREMMDDTLELDVI